MRKHARTDILPWYTHVCGVAQDVSFVEGRLKYKGGKILAPFPGAAIIYRAWNMSEVSSDRENLSVKTLKGDGYHEEDGFSGGNAFGAGDERSRHHHDGNRPVQRHSF